MTILEELDWRGLYADCTDRDGLAQRCAAGPLALYCGFDPTADSLHVGNLVPLFALRRFQLHGHHPIALAGGATGMVGDPSGKSDERNLLTPDQLRHNLDCIKPQLARFLDFSAAKNPARLVNNYDWTGPVSFLEFLRDIGKHITVNSMVAKDSVRARMEDRASGISFTEFSYMLLQAFDFLHLRQELNCEVQIGATDQWGNITVGTELIRKKLGATAWGLVFPLLTKADGSKFGKTATGTVWLDPKKTLPTDFYQFFLKADDHDVIKLVKTLTFLSREEIENLNAEHGKNPAARVAQKMLAWEMTKLVHGEEEAKKCAAASQVIFGKAKLTELSAPVLAETAAKLKNIPFDPSNPTSTTNPINKSLTEVVTISGLAPSRNQARQLIVSGGIYLNGEQLKNPALSIHQGMLLTGHYLFLQKGTSQNVVFTDIPPAGVHPTLLAPPEIPSPPNPG